MGLTSIAGVWRSADDPRAMFLLRSRSAHHLIVGGGPDLCPGSLPVERSLQPRRSGSLAFSKLRNVVFEQVDLTEASFIDAQLESVAFLDCKLAGSDFRVGKLKGCIIQGTIAGRDGLRTRTLEVPWARQ